MGANVLVELKKKILTWGIFFKNWGQKIILGSRKSAFLGIILTPGQDAFCTVYDLRLNNINLIFLIERVYLLRDS